MNSFVHTDGWKMVKLFNGDKTLSSKNMKVFISGKISGIENVAFQLFAEAERLLQALGYETINPMTLNHDHDRSWNSYMNVCIKALCECDGIYMIPNWNDSRGANVEFFISEILGLKKIIPPEYIPTGQDTLTEETIIYNFETKEEDVIVDYKNGRSSISKNGRAFHVSAHVLGGGWKAVKKTGFSNFENKIKNKFSSKNIYLDDLRTPKDLPFCETWEIVRSYDEFISKVNEIGFEKIGIISLDHDLGDSAMAEWQNNVVKNYELEYKNISEKTGYDCAKWIVEQWMQGKPICKVVTHSANAIGSANIMGYINNFKHISGLEQDCIRVKIEFEII